MSDNTPTGTALNASPDHDLAKQVKISDRIIKRIEYADKARKRVREGWIPEQTFLDEFIDVNCTPMGQDIEYGDDLSWHSLHGAWCLVGAYLSEAMSSYDEDLV